MRILMISDVYFPRINGVSTSIQTFRSELTKQGHEVVLIAPSYNANVEPDSHIIRIPSSRIYLDPEDRIMKYSKIIRQIETLRELNFDLIHVHTPFIAHYAGLKISKALQIPCIVTYHTLFEEYLYHYIPWLPQSFLKFIARRFSTTQCDQSDGVISPSKIIVDLLQQYGVKKEMITLPTGINSSKFKQGNGPGFRAELGIAPDTKILLNVSRVAFEKNIELLIQTFAELCLHRSDTHLVIAGEGPARDTYITQVKSLELTEKTSFVGYLDRDSELINCYHAADVFIFASKTETQGLVLLEAMACGTPVVSVAEMGTKSVLQEGIGARITDGSVPDFALKISEVLQDRDMYSDLSSSAIRYASQWDSAKLAGDLADYYQQICENHDRQTQQSAEQI